MWPRSAWNKDRAWSPSGISAALAIESAFERALAAASGSKLGNRSSHAASLPIRWLGLTRTSSQTRLALGRGQVATSRPPASTAKKPKSLMCTRALPAERASSAKRAGTAALSHPDDP